MRRYPFGEKLNDAVPAVDGRRCWPGRDANRRPPFLIDFSIRAASIPSVSFVDVLRGDAASLDKLKDKKVIVGATALELGDRFSVPNGRIASWAGAPGAGGGIDPPAPHAAPDVRCRHDVRPGRDVHC